MTYTEAIEAFRVSGVVEIERRRGKIILHHWPKGLSGPKGPVVEISTRNK